MLRTVAPGHVSNRFNNGTTILDETDFNYHQEELVNAIIALGGTLAADEDQLGTLLAAAFEKTISTAKLTRPFILSGLTISNTGLSVTLAVGKVAVGANVVELLTGESTRTFSVTANRTIYVSLKSDGTVAWYQTSHTQPVSSSILGTLLYVLRSDGSTIVTTYRHASVTTIEQGRKAVVHLKRTTDSTITNTASDESFESCPIDTHGLYHSTKGVLIPPWIMNVNVKVRVQFATTSSPTRTLNAIYSHSILDIYASASYPGDAPGSKYLHGVSIPLLNPATWMTSGGGYADALPLTINLKRAETGGTDITVEQVDLIIEFDL